MKAPWLYGLLLVLCAAVASRTTFTNDISLLVPADCPLPKAMDLLRDFSVADVMVIELDGTGVAPHRLHESVNSLVAALDAYPSFATVRYRVMLDEGVALQVALAPVSPALIPAPDLAQRASPEGMAEALDGWLAKLSGPAGSLFEQAFVVDPLDLWSLATEAVRQAPGPFRVRVEGGHFLDDSGQRAVIFVQPVESALVADPSGAILQRIETHIAAGELPGDYLGGHRFASESAAMIYRDLFRSGALGIASLLVLFALGFRSLRPALGGIAPLLLGVAAGGAACGLTPPVHGISLGFTAPLLGLGIDYWIHLYVEASATRGETFAERLAQARAARRKLLAAYALGAGSTMLAFGILTTSAYPVVSDLGVLGVAAVAGALGGTWLLGPWLCAWIGHRPFPFFFRGEHGRFLRLVALGFTVICLAGVPKTSFDGDPRNLTGVEEATAELEASWGERYGGFGTGGMVVVGATTPSEALDLAGQVQVIASSFEGVNVAGPLAALPGPATIARRLAALPDDTTLRADLERAALQAGFTPGATAGALIPRPSELPLDTWDGTPLEELTRRHVRRTDTGTEVMLTLDFEDDDVALAVETAVLEVAPDARLLVPVRLAQAGVEEIRRELLRLGGLAALGILALLVLRYRDPRRVLAAMLPCVAAVVWTTGIMGLTGQPWNAVTASAMVLILGLGLDYGVFMVESARRNHADTTRHAVILSALTTLAGFGTLVTAGSPVLSTVGLAALTGILGAAVAALAWVVWVAAPRGGRPDGRGVVSSS